MSPDGGGADEWLLLSATVARMSELHPVYCSYPGYARRDLETAIRAERARIRGLSGEGDVVTIGRLTGNHRLDLIQNTLTERRPGPMGDRILFWNVEIEWTGISSYLRAFAVKRLDKGVVASPHKDAADGTRTQPDKTSQRDVAIANKLGARPGQDQTGRGRNSATRSAMKLVAGLVILLAAPNGAFQISRSRVLLVL